MTPSLFHLARSVDRLLPRTLIASLANAMMSLRGDERRFAVDAAGRWINRQPDATFVSPDIDTSHFFQVEAAVRENWCQFYTPKTGDTVIDVGAGIGQEAVVFSKIVGPSGRVISIEAHPGTFSCLQETIRCSGLTNVEPVHCAVAAEDGVTRISDSDEHIANSVLADGDGIEVPARSLDSLTADLGLSKVDFLKMNIEGAESAAVRGMRQSAARVVNVAISCHDFVADSIGDDRFRTLAQVEPALRTLGYDLLRVQDPAHPWLRDSLYGHRRPA